VKVFKKLLKIMKTDNWLFYRAGQPKVLLKSDIQQAPQVYTPAAAKTTAGSAKTTK
jgi:hypothetical protein